jgi:TRAP-type C4-dicarboxylate transport system substrate-binding protein
MMEVSDALKQYATDNAGGPGAIYVGDINQMVGPAPLKPSGAADTDLGDSEGNVPLSALEDHLWLYDSDYYWSLLDRASLENPTALTSSGESITVQHACINRALLPCKIIEQYWAPNLEARTNGQLLLEVSSFPELGLAGPDTLQLVSEGTLSMANIYTGYVAGALPAIEVQSLWGIYPDWETMYYSLTDMHPQLEEMVAGETGGGIIVNHNWYSGNDQFFFSKKPLRTLEDFEGLKTRSHAAALSDWINGMGAEAQFLAFAEVYTALERGILDAGVTGSTPGHGQRWYEVTTYLNGPLKSLLSTNNIVNADVWNEIPEDLQNIFIEEGAKSELEQLRLTSIQNVTGVQKNVDAGMELVEFTPDLADYSLNVAVMEHVVPGWLRRLGYPGKGDEAVAMFNEHVGPYVGVSISEDGNVDTTAITKGPHAQ